MTGAEESVTALLAGVLFALAGGATAWDRAAVAAVARAKTIRTRALADTDENDNQRTGTPNMTVQNANLPKEKQTNLGLYLTAKQAYERAANPRGALNARSTMIA